MLTRRSALVGLAAITACTPTVSSPLEKRVAVTMDDFAIPEDPARALERDARIRSHLPEPAVAFVTGQYETRPAFDAILQNWAADGHIIANHTYSHMWSSKEPTQTVWDDIARNHRLLKDRDGFQPYFRFPFLDEGRDRAQQLEYYARLKEAGYTLSPATIDTYDWNVTQRLEKPTAAPQRIRDYWIESVLLRANYDQAIAEAIGVPDLPHQMLVHHNALNALFLGDLLAAMKADGWTIVSAKTALDDPLYAKSPPEGYPGGPWLSRLATEAGLTDPKFPDVFQDYGTAAMDALGL